MCFFAILQFLFFHCKRLFPWIQAFERGKAFGEAEGLCMDVCGGFSVLFSIRCFGRLGRPAVCRQAGSSLYQKIFYTWRDKSSYHLWWVLSACYSLLLLLGIWRFVPQQKRDAVLGAASIIMFVAALLVDWLLAGEHNMPALNDLSAVVGKITHTGRVLTGPFYMWIGLLFAKKFPIRPTLAFCSILLLTGVAFQMIELQFPIPNVAFYIGAFSGALHIMRLPFETSWCRRASSAIYFVHMAPVSIFMYLIIKLPLGMMLFVTAAFFSAVASMAWIFLNENILKRNNKRYAR